MKAYAYLRISSRSQKSKYGLKTQKDDINRAEKTYNLKIMRWYQDIASGRTNKRNDFLQMTEDLKQNPDVKVVIIARVSRLGRNVLEMLLWKKELDELGVKLYIAEGGLIDTDTVAGKMSFYVQCVFAEIELDQITDQMQKGLAKYKEKLKEEKNERRNQKN